MWPLGVLPLDIDDCVNHTCANGASCVDGINNYACNCTTGFTGAYCETGNYWNHKEKHVTSLAQPLSNDQVQIWNCSFVIFFQPLTSVSNTLRVIISWQFHVTIVIVVHEWVKHVTGKKEKEKKIWTEKSFIYVYAFIYVIYKFFNRNFLHCTLAILRYL